LNTIRCDSCRRLFTFGNEVLEKNKGKKFAWAFCPHCGNATCIINKGETLYENDDATEITKVDVKPKKRGRKPKEK
jgi:Zn finger protein HypA/HybF involved in hydrogenase expression